MLNSQFTFLALRSCASTQQLQHASLKKCCARDKLCCDFACRVSQPVVGPFYIAQADWKQVKSFCGTKDGMGYEY